MIFFGAFGYVFALALVVLNVAAFLTASWEKYKEVFWKMNGVVFWVFFMVFVAFGLPIYFPVDNVYGFGAYFAGIVLFLVCGVCGFANYMTYGNVFGK